MPKNNAKNKTILGPLIVIASRIKSFEKNPLRKGSPESLRLALKKIDKVKGDLVRAKAIVRIS